jgi:hypothetical protein
VVFRRVNAVRARRRDLVTGDERRDGLRVERERRRAERVLAHLRGITLDEAARALGDHARLTGTSVVEVARDVLAHRPVVRPRVLRQITDLESWAATGRADTEASGFRIPAQPTTSPRDDETEDGGGPSRA